MSGHDLGFNASSVLIRPGDTINSFEMGQSLAQCLHASSMPGPLHLTITLKSQNNKQTNKSPTQTNTQNQKPNKKCISRYLAIPSNLSIMRVSGHCTCASSTGSLVVIFSHCLVPALLYEGVQIYRLLRICQELMLSSLSC